MGEQIEIKSSDVMNKIKYDKRLNPLEQNYIPNIPTAVTSITVNEFQNPQSPTTSVKYPKNNGTRTGTTPRTVNYNINKGPAMTITVNHSNNKEGEVTSTTQYCGEQYDGEHAWKNILAEQEEYIEILTLEISQEKNNYIPLNLPNVPFIRETIKTTTTPSTTQDPKTTQQLQYKAYHPRPQKLTENKHYTKRAHTTYNIPATSETNII